MIYVKCDVLDIVNGIYVRKEDTKLITENKFTEFLYILQLITKEKFNPIDWKYCPEYNQTESRCICTQEIKHQFVIKHMKTGYRFQVGSECVKKVNERLATCLNALKEGKGFCSRCDEVLCDMRLKSYKEGLCEECFKYSTCRKCGVKILACYKDCYRCFMKKN
jgi:hypothetical protein